MIWGFPERKVGFGYLGTASDPMGCLFSLAPMFEAHEDSSPNRWGTNFERDVCGLFKFNRESTPALERIKSELSKHVREPSQITLRFSFLQEGEAVGGREIGISAGMHGMGNRVGVGMEPRGLLQLFHTLSSFG